MWHLVDNLCIELKLGFLPYRFEAEDDGVDVIIDCTGVPGALEAAIPWTKMGRLRNDFNQKLDF